VRSAECFQGVSMNSMCAACVRCRREASGGLVVGTSAADNGRAQRGDDEHKQNSSIMAAKGEHRG
jgi:hypothetical protein